MNPKYLLFLINLFFVFTVKSQSFNEDKTAMINFLKRMYNNAPFEGVKVFEDYDAKYLISVISLEKAKYTSQSTMNRVAQVKAQSQTSRFFNGAVTESDFIVRTKEEKQTGSADIKTTVETIESIKESSIGFVNGIELLSNFEIEDGKRMLFIYFKELKKE
jgi:predicted house-cleaning NTP pyrophosphatase (Maf/HAM1 superfamily)